MTVKPVPERDTAHGVRYPQTPAEMFQTVWREPGPALVPFVQRYWITTWDLRGQPPYLQRVLPSPSVNLTLKRGRSRIAGVSRGQFTELLERPSQVASCRFTKSSDRKVPP